MEVCEDIIQNVNTGYSEEASIYTLPPHISIIWIGRVLLLEFKIFNIVLKWEVQKWKSNFLKNKRKNFSWNVYAFITKYFMDSLKSYFLK